MKNIIIASIVLLSSFSVLGQTNISSNDTICDCSNAGSGFLNGSVNFFDDAGSAADYSSNVNDTITFCPDGGASKISVAFGVNSGFSWDIDASDTLYVYDGPNTSSPLIGAYNSITDPAGAPSFTTSWGNTSGCLTLVFISDGSGEGTGWKAKVSCANPVQPFTPHMNAFINGEANGGTDLVNDLNPADTGYVDVCFGDTIMFVGSAVFPYDPANTGNGGYDQINNHSYAWSFSNGDSFTGDTIYFVPPYRSGFLVRLDILDGFPQTKTIFSTVRVSTVPSFATCSALKDTICDGALTQLVGGVTAGDTVGVEGQAGSIDIGGAFATLTALPDGSGQNYTTDINIQGFPVGATIQNGSDVSRVCLSMEHSYLGDLEMKLTCPNGQSVNIFNANTGNGLFPGGFGGGSTFLGGAKDNSTGSPGVCEEYCFSNQVGSLPAWVNGSYNTIAASGPSTGLMIEPGTYNPEESFTNFIGCPVNGLWTITVRDNLSTDDGFICEWGIFLSGTLDPNTENYTPSILNSFWSPNPSIVNGGSDTSIFVKPPIGTSVFKFNVEDSYGCNYDTSVNVVVIQGPSISNPAVGCLNQGGGSTVVQFTNTFAPEGGSWSYPSELTPNFPTSFINQGFTSNTSGTFTVTFSDVQCGNTLTQDITFSPLPTANILNEDSEICRGDSMLITIETSDPNNVIWNTFPVSTNTTIAVSDSGVYTVTVNNACGVASDNIHITVIDCKIPNVITPNGDGENDYFYTNIADTYEDVVFTVFNRWGIQVYDSEHYDNTWNGVNKGGGALNAGVYYYVLTYNAGKKIEKGFITILK